MNSVYINDIKRLYVVTRSLLSAKSIKYSEWNAGEKHLILNSQAGVYHFYKICNKQIVSLYVGKASFGSNEKWSLFQRIKQHFQTSQRNTFLWKYAKANDLSMELAKSELNASDIYLQWLPIEVPECDHLRRELMRVECFCKSILNPIYTDE